MKLSELVKDIEFKLICGNPEVEVEAITINSGKVKKGSLFVCIKGLTFDAHKFIPEAFEKGCAAVVCESEQEKLPEGITAILVDNSRDFLAKAAKNFYDNPSAKFELIGVTGTNGKTSTTYYIEEILKRNNRRCGVIGTVDIRINGEKQDLSLATSTTPDTIELNELFCAMLDKNADAVVMEVSSHGLAQKRVSGLSFDIGIFTNLTQDHLDFHGTMENYCDSKAMLFSMCRIGLVNSDDKWSERVSRNNGDCVIKTFAIDDENACYRAQNIKYSSSGSDFTVKLGDKLVDFQLNIPGRFSVYNALSAIAACYESGVSAEVIKEGIEAVTGVPGRVEEIENDKGFGVIIDYAHTPDGLENILNTVREFTEGRVICVFGCGGDRDRRKRPIMGEIAARLSDYSVITSDNPRSEEPIDIIKEIEVGYKEISTSYEIVVDRRDAIFRAVEIAKQGDCIVIAGKGHENYEIFKDRTIHFDDGEVAREALQ